MSAPTSWAMASVRTCRAWTIGAGPSLTTFRLSAAPWMRSRPGSIPAQEFGGDYDEELAYQRARDRAYSHMHPTEGAIGTGLGIAAGAVVGARALPGRLPATLPGKMGAGAVVGATGGAVEGLRAVTRLRLAWTTPSRAQRGVLALEPWRQ